MLIQLKSCLKNILQWQKVKAHLLKIRLLNQTPGEMMIMETKQLLSFQTGHPRQLLANTKLMSEKK